jgi:hypothetical protein
MIFTPSASYEEHVTIDENTGLDEEESILDSLQFYVPKG